jgi:hypothetical protein
MKRGPRMRPGGDMVARTEEAVGASSLHVAVLDVANEGTPGEW